MLVLSRKVGERVVIDGRVTVVVTRVVGNRVTLGIDAPKDVHVLRGELQGEPQGSELGKRSLEGPQFDSPSTVVPASNAPLSNAPLSSLPAEESSRRAPLAAMTAAVLAAHVAATVVP